MRKKGLFGLLLFFFFSATLYAGNPIHVVASVPVLGRFLEEIASKDIHVTVLTHQGGSAHVFEPSATEVIEIRRAALFFAIPSLSHERGYLGRIKRLNPKLVVVDLETAVPHAFKTGGLEGDPHIWMSPLVLVDVVQKMVASLSKKQPTQREVYHRRAQAIIGRLVAEDRRIHQRLASVKPRVFLTYHPSFGYFAQAYGLTQHALEQEGKSVSASYFRKTLSEAKKAGVHTFFIHPGLSSGMVSRVATSVNCRPVLIDVLDPDIFGVWERMIQALVVVR